MKKANKQEMELRAGFAADLLAQGHSCTVVTTRVTEEYELSRRQARRITAKAMDLIVQDFEEINIERPQMVAKLLVNHEQGMQKGLLNNQSSCIDALQDEEFHWLDWLLILYTTQEGGELLASPLL